MNCYFCQTYLYRNIYCPKCKTETYKIIDSFYEMCLDFNYKEYDYSAIWSFDTIIRKFMLIRYPNVGFNENIILNLQEINNPILITPLNILHKLPILLAFK